MLGLRPLGGSALLAVSLPEAPADAFDRIARNRDAEFAIVFEATAFPKFFPLDSGGAHPLLGSPLLNGPAIAGEDVGVSISPITVHLSDYPYRTRPNDPLRPNLWTEARMTRRAIVEQSAPVSQGASRRSQETSGDLEFADNDGYIRALTDTHSFNKRNAKISVVEIGQPWANATTVSQSLVKYVTRPKKSARFLVEDASSKLDLPIVQRIYGGSGLRDGSPDLKDTAPPMGWGLCKYAKPLLEDPSIYLYRLSDLGVNAVHRVEEAGIAFTFDEDVATYELLRIKASALAEGQYATCLSDGSLVIKFAGGEPGDPDAIRVTFEGDTAGGTYVNLIGDVLFNMAAYSVGVPFSEISRETFQALPQHVISYYFSGGSASPTGARVFNDIMESAFGTFGSVVDEKLGVKLFYPPMNQPASEAFGADEIYSVDEVEPPQAAIWSQSMGWGPNQNPYERDDLAIGSLTESEIEERARTFEGTYVELSGNVFAADAGAVEGSVINGVFDEEAAAADAVTRLMGVWGIYSKTFEVTFSFAAARVSRGSIIKVTDEQLGAKSGEKFLVFNKRFDFSKRRVILTITG